MKEKLSQITRKIFATLIAITMSIPPTAFASNDDIRVYDASSSVMGLAEDEKVNDIDQLRQEGSTGDILDLGSYTLDTKANLDQSLTKINYTLTLRAKEEVDPDKEISLNLATGESSSIKNLKLTGASTDVSEERTDENGLKNLKLKSKSADEISYDLEADIREAKDKRTYNLILGLKDGENVSIKDLSLMAVEETSFVEEEEVTSLGLERIDQSEIKAQGTYKEGGLLEGLIGNKDTIIWTDYILNDGENEEFDYEFNLDENQDTQSSKIALDYYELTDTGFKIKKEFSQEIDFSEKINFEIPENFVAKISLKTEVSKKNTAVKNYSLNNRTIQNPIYKEGEEEKSADDDEDPEGESKENEPEETSDQNTEEDTLNAKKSEDSSEEKSSEETDKEDSEEIKVEDGKKDHRLSALLLNKDSLIKKLEDEGSLTEEDEKLIEDLAENLNSYNEGKITDQDLKDFTKAIAENKALEKETLKSYLEEILLGLNKETNKAAGLDIADLMAYVYPGEKDSKEDKSEDKDLTKLEKADKELKEALADEKNGLEEIQALLDSFEEKYNLDRDAQARLMTDNNDAIVALVEKDREENFRPNVLATASQSFEGKEFKLKTTMNAIASQANPIPNGYYFDVKVGKYLKLKQNDFIKPLTVDGRIVAVGQYFEDGDDHYIRYTYVTRVTKDLDLDIDQILVFDTDNIGDRESVDINIKVIPKNNPAQSMPTITVKKNAKSPVIPNFDDTEQEETQSGSYPYQLNWKTTSQKLKDKKGNVIDKNYYLDSDKLQDAYVEWDIEVDTSTLTDSENELEFNNLNLAVFGSANQGLKNFKFKASSDKNDLDSGYIVSKNMDELLSRGTQIKKSDLGDKLYIKVKAEIDPDQVHETYNIGFRINPDKNYIDNLLTEYKNKLDRLPTPIKWLKGVEDAQRFAEVPFNLVETNIPATFFGLNDRFTNERFYYDNTRTIVADRKSDTRADWYALDLLRRGETQDPALDNPTFDINNGKENQTIKRRKVYFIPLKDGGYKRTTQAQDAILPNGQYYPGTIISYRYVKEEGKRNDTYNFRASLKEKKKYNIDEAYDTEGGSVNLFTEKVSDQALVNGYLAYIESPYPVMRINKNFDLVSCFNDRINAPVYDGSKGGVFLDIHEDVSGDYLLDRLNESIENPSGEHRLRNLLKKDAKYNTVSEYGNETVNLNNGEKTEGQAMEELMKKIYFYGEEVKKEYSEERNNEEMHRMIEASMYQRLIHHFTDGKALSEDYFDAPSDYNVDEWKVDHTLQGNHKPYPQKGWEDSFEGSDDERKTKLGLRKLKDNETRIKNYPPVQKTQYEMAKRLYKKVIDSYKDGNDWDDDKADSVKLVFYSHTDEGKYQELIAGRVMEPIEIDKYKRSGDKIFGEKLPGAEFEFTNVNTGESKIWKSPKDKNAVNKLYLRPGRYRVQEIGTPTGYEKIKDFEITVKRTEINPDNGPYKAKKLPKIHVNDGFKTEVVLAKNLPQTPDGKALVAFDERNNIKVNVSNIEDNLGKLEFVKRNKFVKLNGAEFRLRKINATDLADAKNKFKTPEDLKYDSKYDKTSKGSYGEFKFEQIPEGFYVLEETKVPEGYEKAPLYLLEAKETTEANNKKKVEVRFVQEYKEVTNEKGEKEAKIADANLDTEKATRDEKEIDLSIIKNETKETEIKFRKVRTENLDTTKEHLGLGDAKFRLMSLSLVDGDFYLKEGFTDHSKPTTNGDRIDGQQARGGGYITFDGLKQGEYLLEELQAPKGYKKTDLYGWKLVVKELKEDDKETGKKKGDLDYKLYEVPTGEDLNSTGLKEVELDQIINGKDKIKAFQIGNDARKINVPFKKYKGKIIENEDGTTDIEATEDTTPLKGKNGDPVSFDLYKSDFYGAIIGEKDKDGNIIPYKKNITQDPNGNFNLEGLEFGGYYILRETNPPAGYDKASDITLKVEAEAVADEGEMKVIVRDPNTNAKTDLHSVFKGVVDFLEDEKLGKFSIKKVGNAIGYTDEKGNPIRVGLRRAYFRLYTANENYEIEYKDKEKKYPKEYIQKVTPGDPITEDDGKGGQKGKDPNKLPPNQGIVTFDQLKPGHYVLEEYRGPAGYERDPNYWYILVERDGTVKKYRDNPESTTDPRTSDYSTQSVRYQTFGLDKIEPIGLSTLMKSVSGLEISDENTPQSVGASGSEDVEIGNTYTNTIMGTNSGTSKVEVTTSVEQLPNDEFKVTVKTKLLAGAGDNAVYELSFNNDFDFVRNSTSSDRQPEESAPYKGRWHSGYNSSSNEIYIPPREPRLKRDQTAIIEFKVTPKDKANLKPGEAYKLFNDITYKPNNKFNTLVHKIEAPTVTFKDNQNITYKEETVLIREIPIPSTPTRRANDSMYKGDERTVFHGAKGKVEERRNYKYISGVKQENDYQVIETITTDAQPPIIEYGTKTKPVNPDPDTFNIDLNQGEGGSLTISPQGPYKPLDDVTVTITPDPGKKLDKLSVGGKEVL